MAFNRTRTLEYMEELGLDALITGSVVNVGYFAGYFCWLDSLFREYMSLPGGSSNLPEAYVVVTRDGDVVLLVNSLWSANTLSLVGVEVRTFGNADFDLAETPQDRLQHDPILTALRNQDYPLIAVQALTQIVEHMGLANSRIGLEMDGMPHERRVSIISRLPSAELRDCSNLIRVIRAVKSPDEIALLSQAASIAEKATAAAVSLAGPGVDAAEMLRRFHEQIASHGAQFDHFAFSPAGLGIAVESDYKFSGDEVMYIDFGCSYYHYLSDSGITLALRSLPQPLEQRYTAINSSIAVGAEALRPGIKASQVQLLMMREFSTHGFGACFPHGHGFGLEVREYPILVPETGLALRDGCIDVSSDLSLEPGMVINLEASTFLPYVGSLQVEKSFVVTATGNQELIEQHREQPHFRTTAHGR